ncbi:MAG: TonB-dependent receptor, partial [Gammaproteobacteria bacterium]
MRVWTILLSCLWSLATIANVLADVPTGNDEEIIVTAARTPIPKRQAGPGVTVITREMIAARNPQYVAELLRDVPGFAVSRLGGVGKQTQLRVRGSEANHVLVLIDGIEANDFTQDDAFDFAHLQANEIERIEIIRGPQSALWGSDALAGTINIITREADKPVTARGGVEFGSFDTRTTSANIGTRQANYHSNIGLSYVDSGGINVARRGNEDDGYRNGTANARFGWRPRDDLSLEFTGRIVEAENERDGGFPLPSDTPAETDVFQAYTSANVRWTGWDGHWVNTATGTFSRFDNHDVDPIEFLDTRAQGSKYRGTLQSSVNLTSDFISAETHVFTVAFDYEKQDFKQRAPVVFG